MTERIIELRPHHVLGFVSHEMNPEFYHLSDEAYVTKFREEKGNFHSDDLILHWREILKQLHNNPELNFRYVATLDSICEECHRKEECHDKNHWQYKSVQNADVDASDYFPELKLEQIYDGHFIKKILTKKVPLKKELIRSDPALGVYIKNDCK